MDDIFKFYEHFPRQGPGTREATHKVYNTLKSLPAEPLILDIGCGTGTQTEHLGEISKGKIIATDINLPFLQKLKTRIGSATIVPATVSMTGLAFKENSFDLIWSEGAIFIMGFEKGLEQWSSYLKTGGYLVVSELSWLKDDIPAELSQFWYSEYPGIKSIDKCKKAIDGIGLKLIDTYTLPPEDFYGSFYEDIEDMLPGLKVKYINSPEIQKEITGMEKEIYYCKKYPEYYGYVFYIMQKV